MEAPELAFQASADLPPHSRVMDVAELADWQFLNPSTINCPYRWVPIDRAGDA